METISDTISDTKQISEVAQLRKKVYGKPQTGGNSSLLKLQIFYHVLKAGKPLRVKAELLMTNSQVNI